MAAAVVILIAYRLHCSREARKGVLPPTDEYLLSLDERLGRLHEERGGLARANGATQGRCDLLSQALERAHEDTAGGAIQYQVGDMLKSLERAEEVVSLHLAHRGE
ncbi:hypothetical protein [Nocardiopsis alborubida]|uniref:Uncharacterized protein n=1 Tax=Nocardiopsis alborubida TaxID=146802 RepID=A0A7X6MDB3_9ACTN|nr:hypothetical protein [Nocardiopsis alborubida]NKY99363.1 hypothetical protein [Nocardiopsis alborubida]